MELTYIIIAVVILLLPVFLGMLNSGDTNIVLGANLRTRHAGVVAPRTVRAIAKSPANQPHPASLTVASARARETRKEVERLVKAGRKIEAIKVLHERVGLGLEQAKDLVDRLT